MWELRDLGHELFFVTFHGSNSGAYDKYHNPTNGSTSYVQNAPDSILDVELAIFLNGVRRGPTGSKSRLDVVASKPSEENEVTSEIGDLVR